MRFQKGNNPENPNNGDGKGDRPVSPIGSNIILLIFVLVVFVVAGVEAIQLLYPHFEQRGGFNETTCLSGWNGNGAITTATSCCSYCHDTTNATFSYKRYVPASTYQRSICLCQRDDFTIYEIEGLGL